MAFLLLRFQSTRPRGARPLSLFAVPRPRVVSIHAPTRGATASAVPGRVWFVVSIHAPTRGATALCLVYYQRGEVSIHAPTRGATRLHNCGHDVDAVSIHAPTRGATCRRGPNRRGGRGFNPRAHAGRDSAQTHVLSPVDGFQSTRPRGARRLLCELVPLHRSVSIHAPTRGATSRRGAPARCCRVSIHAPTRGATVRDAVRGGVRGVSIHAPTRGATVPPAPRGLGIRVIAPSCHNAEQLGTKFVDSRRQHALGLDARLARRVEPQQVHHNVANDGQVVGGIAAAHP